MPAPVFYVDFNEMVDDNTVLLSADDSKIDASGVSIQLNEGMPVSIYMDDVDEHGNTDDLVARGVVVRNIQEGWSSHVKWCCRIDRDGIRRRSTSVYK